jgi:excinuclease UvrABC ATPase subunit
MAVASSSWRRLCAVARAPTRPSEEIRKAGFVPPVDGTVHSLDDEITLDRYKQHDIDAVVDRLVISHAGAAEDLKSARSRLTDSVETALKFGEGFLTVALADGRKSDGATAGRALRRY